MEKCPQCGRDVYKLDSIYMKFYCYGCGYMESDKEKERRLVKSKGLVYIEDFEKALQRIEKLEKQLEELLNKEKPESQ